MNSNQQWPFGSLDVGAALSNGFRPYPFREFVLKVHQRCNLACDYCYVYMLADQSWRDRPPEMTKDVWYAAAERIAEHARTHRLPEVLVVLHGGEPLLAGVDRLVSQVGHLRARLPAGCEGRVTMQTNGVLLDEAAVQTLCTAGINVGVSLDGTREANDRHRRRHNGQGSHAVVHQALTILCDARYRPAFAGLLCTVDPSTDPVETYEALLAYGPPAIDFLLPHANWSRPPRRPSSSGTPYGDWLAEVFDRWYGAPSQETHVRILEEIVILVLGGASRSEQIGLSPVGVVVIESDGDIEQVDSLKSTYSGACATGLNVFADTLDDALRHPGIAARQLGVAALCATCLACPVHRICGAGHYAHRYSADRGFLNPSVYCPDLLRLINHVHRRLQADLKVRMASQTE